MSFNEALQHLDWNRWNVPEFIYTKTKTPRFRKYTLKADSKQLYRVSIRYFIMQRSKPVDLSYNSFESEVSAKFYAPIIRDILELRGKRECHLIHKQIVAMNTVEQLTYFLNQLQQEKIAKCSSIERPPIICNLCPYNSRCLSYNEENMRPCMFEEWLQDWCDQYEESQTFLIGFVEERTGNEAAGSQFHCDEKTVQFIIDALNYETYNNTKIFDQLSTQDLLIFHVFNYTDVPTICQTLITCIIARWEIIECSVNMTEDAAKCFNPPNEVENNNLCKIAHSFVTESDGRRWEPTYDRVDNYFGNILYNVNDEYAQLYSNYIGQIVIVVDLNESLCNASKWFLPAVSSSEQVDVQPDKVLVLIRTKRGNNCVGPEYWGTIVTCRCMAKQN